MIIIPIETSRSSYIIQSVNMGEFVCRLRLLWNLRDKSWYCDFSSTSGENVGVRLVKDTPLLGKRSRLGYDGDFRVIGTNSTRNAEISFDNLGKDFKLVFGTSDEWREFDDV